MKARPFPRMSADEFIAWAMARPEGERYELVGGEVFAMSPERLGHARSKGAAYRALGDAIRKAGLPCEALPDGISVRVDADTVYEPDALVRCGEAAEDEIVEISDPVIVVEVLSPSTGSIDLTAKLADYFRLPSLRHYLVVNRKRRSVVHHRRDDAGTIQTTILRERGTLSLHPPGLTIEVADLF